MSLLRSSFRTFLTKSKTDAKTTTARRGESAVFGEVEAFGAAFGVAAAFRAGSG